MADNELSYKILRHIQQSEQQSPTLTRIQHDFYIQLQTYLQELKDIVTNEQDPKKQALYEDEQKNTAKIGQYIFELREKKIVQAALSKVRGAQPDLNNLLDPEKILYDALVELIRSQRTQIQQTPQPSQKTEPQPEQPPQEPTDETPQTTTNTNPIIRITDTIPGFVGTNMQTYHLRKNDVLSIPPDMAKILQKRKVATLVR
jgi:DNA replication initiation complex subunit (GINS family)